MKSILFAAVAAACLAAPGLALAGDGPSVSGNLTAGVSANDNIFASNGGEVSDTVFEVSGGVTLQNETDAGYVKAYGTFDIEQYSDVDDENAEDFSVGLKGGLNFGDGGQLFGGASHALNTEDRTQRTARRDTRERTDFTVDAGNVGVSFDLGPGKVTAQAGVKAYDYEDGETRIGGFLVDQDRRDRTVSSQSLRIDFDLQEGVGAFVAVGRSETDYDLLPPLAPHNRDSEGASATAGLTFKAASNISGEVEIGWSGRSFDQVGFDDASTLFVSANLTWTPSEQTTWTLSASRSFQETTVLGSPIYVATVLGVSLEQELSDRFTLNLALSREWDEHEQIDRSDDATVFEIGLTAGLSEKLVAGVNYNYSSEDSSGLFASPGYDVGVASAFLKLKF